MNYEFLKQDTQVRAYFLGIFMADGSLSNTSVNMDLIDKQIIYDLADRIGYHKPISNYVSNTSFGITNKYRITLSSKKAVNDLVSLGFTVGPKTGKEFIPECVKQDKMTHFLRGLSDGDGCFTIIKNRANSYLEWNITCPNKEFLEEILLFLRQHSIISYSGHSVRIRPSKNCYRISLGHHDAIRLGEYLYKDSSIHLERKKQKWENGLKISCKKLAKWTYQELLCAIKELPCLTRNKTAISIKRSEIRTGKFNFNENLIVEV